MALVGATPASAHVFGGAVNGGFLAGFAHPFAGLDHLLAMIAVGLWAAHLGGRARVLVPATFVAAMVAGSALGMAGLALPHVELAIALSVAAFGALIGLRARAFVVLGMAAVAAFAVFHGHAHGAEMPTAALPELYGLGFALATAALHGIGLFAGMLAVKARDGLPAPLARASGGALVAAGLVLAVL